MNELKKDAEQFFGKLEPPNAAQEAAKRMLDELELHEDELNTEELNLAKDIKVMAEAILADKRPVTEVICRNARINAASAAAAQASR
jgi:hypothetical protein